MTVRSPQEEAGEHKQRAVAPIVAVIARTAGRYTATSGERTAVQAACRESSFHARRLRLFY